MATSQARASKSDFNKFAVYGEAPNKLTCSLSEIKIIDSDQIITDIYYDLVRGLSVKEVLTKWKINLDLDYDVNFENPQNNLPLHIEKVFDNVTTYVESFAMSDPKTLFVFDSSTPPDWASKALDDLTEKVTDKVKLPKDIMMRHIGSLDLFKTTDYDCYGNPFVNVERPRESENTLNITFADDLIKGSDCLIVNAKLSRGDYLMVDSIQIVSLPCKDVPHVTFTSKEKINRFEISVWRKEKDETWLVHHEQKVFIESICLNIGIIGLEVSVNNEWFDRIRAAVPNTDKCNEDLKKAQKIQHSTTESTTVLLNDDANKTSKDRKKQLKPLTNLKSKDGFFPKGWDKESESHGALEFFKWFQDITRDATDVMLQDPYIEDVALHFIMSSGSARFTLITQTSLKTNSDGTSYVEEEREGHPSRKDKILNLISHHPTLFRHTDFVIQDITGRDNKLHDRYLFVDYPDGRSIGFTLSNSLQGATTKQPLLVTEIGESTLHNVKDHVQSNIERRKTEGTLATIYDSKNDTPKTAYLKNQIVDPEFYKWLCEYIKSHGDVDNITESDINYIIDDILYGPYSTKDNLFGKISAACKLLAEVRGDKEEILMNKIVSVFRNRTDMVRELKEFILKGHYEYYPIGYRNHIGRPAYYQLYQILSGDFNQILDNARSHLIDFALSEHYYYDNFGLYFASEILTRVSPEETIDVLRQLYPTLISIKSDPQVTPICKITDVLLHGIFYANAIYGEFSIMKGLLQDQNDVFRALGALLMLYNYEYRETTVADAITIADIKAYLSNGIITDEEALAICKTALCIFPRLSEYEKWLKITILYLCKFSMERIKGEIKDFLCGRTPKEAKLAFVGYVIPSVPPTNSITAEDIESYLLDILYDLSEESDNCQIILPQALKALGCTPGKLIDRIKKDIVNFDKELTTPMLPNTENLWRLKIPLHNAKQLLNNLEETEDIIDLRNEIESRLNRKEN